MAERSLLRAGCAHATAPGLSGGEEGASLRSQVVRVFHAPPLSLRPRSTWQGGYSGPRCIPPSMACRPWTLPTLTRGGRAQSPWDGAGTVDGALCISGDMPAARGGSGLTWAGQPAGHLDDARPDTLPAPAFTRPVCTAWTARPWEAPTWTR